MVYLKQAGSFRPVPTGQVFASLKSHHFNNIVGNVTREAKDRADMGTENMLLNENQGALATLGLMYGDE